MAAVRIYPPTLTPIAVTEINPIITNTSPRPVCAALAYHDGGI